MSINPARFYTGENPVINPFVLTTPLRIKTGVKWILKSTLAYLAYLPQELGKWTMVFSTEAEFICFEKEHIWQSQNLEKREANESIHKQSHRGREKKNSSCCISRGELNELHKASFPAQTNTHLLLSCLDSRAQLGHGWALLGDAECLHAQQLSPLREQAANRHHPYKHRKEAYFGN